MEKTFDDHVEFLLSIFFTPHADDIWDRQSILICWVLKCRDDVKFTENKIIGTNCEPDTERNHPTNASLIKNIIYRFHHLGQEFINEEWNNLMEMTPFTSTDYVGPYLRYLKDFLFR